MTPIVLLLAGCPLIGAADLEDARDRDGDGLDAINLGGTDCDDTDPQIGGPSPLYTDADGDGYGDPEDLVPSCEVTAGLVANNTDCDDADPAAHPGAIWGLDLDGDGFAGQETQLSCLSPDALQPWTPTLGDCDDDRADVYPDAPGEIMNDGIDTDCREDTELDADGDGLPDLPPDAAAACAGTPRTLWSVPGDHDSLHDALQAASDCDAISLAIDSSGFELDKHLSIFAAPGTHPRVIAAPTEVVGITVGASATLEGLVVEGFERAVVVRALAGASDPLPAHTHLVAGHLILRGGEGISSQPGVTLSLYDLSIQDSNAALLHQRGALADGVSDGGSLVLERCLIEGALASQDVIHIESGASVAIRSCSIRRSAAGSGSVLWIDTGALEIDGLWLEENVGVAMDLNGTFNLRRDASYELSDVHLIGNTSTGPHLARVWGASGATLALQDLEVRDNTWDQLADQDVLSSLGLEGLIVLDHVETELIRARFRGNVMARGEPAPHLLLRGPQLWMTPETFQLQNVEISGRGNVGVELHSGTLRHLTLVGLDAALRVRGEVLLDSAIVAHNQAILEAAGVLEQGLLTVSWSVLSDNTDPTVPILGSGNVLLDPRLLRFDRALPAELWDLRPLPDSPARGAGHPAYPNPDGSDGDSGAYGGPLADPGAMVDGDGDGLYDTWEVQWLGSTTPGAGDDADSDGWSNEVEFCNGTLPAIDDTDGDTLLDSTDPCPLSPADPCLAPDLPRPTCAP